MNRKKVVNLWNANNNSNLITIDIQHTSNSYTSMEQTTYVRSKAKILWKNWYKHLQARQ